MTTFNIGNHKIGPNQETYFIADVAANHDGDLERAKDLIYMVAEAGGHAAKFQNFQARKIVSQRGFDDLKGQLAHQTKWKKSVVEVYEDASIDKMWTETLKETCDKVGIDYFTSPYDFDSIDLVDPYVDVYKVGSGDITWVEIIEYMADKGKPMMIATGAADIEDVKRVMSALEKKTQNIVLMQCNTNYTGSYENFNFINLNVLHKYKELFPNATLGLSDHTHGHATVLGAVALGAKVIEKHFTDDNNRDGPDHTFSMNPKTWREMVDRTKELEASMGTTTKMIEGNEIQSIVVQRRSIRAKADIPAGKVLARNDFEVLRPIPEDGLPPYEIDKILGKKLKKALEYGEHITWSHI